jgi:hypothetical protein
MLDVKNLLFRVDDDGNVMLVVGPLRTVVCDAPEQFEEFVESLIDQLHAIRDEIKEYHC